MRLTQAQTAAIGHIETHALLRKGKAQGMIEQVCAMANISRTEIDQALYQVKTNASVVVHFHPDRLSAKGESVAEALLASGWYGNQFETGLSNGKLSPYPGGAREQWENQLFGGAYAAAPPFERPKYGALDLMRHGDGASPRFGSCYLVLTPSVSQRCTFTYMDSYRAPPEKGTLAVFEDMLAALLTECFERWYALGQRHITPANLISQLIQTLPEPYPNPALLPPARNLNQYIEAQIHGPLQLERDVIRLTADPSFKEDKTGEILRRLCEKYAVELCWHGGFRMAVADVPRDFRGPAMPSLARRIATNGWFDTRLIGQAAVEVTKNPAQWQDRGTAEQCLQELKLLWHVLVQYGAPMA